MSPLPITGDVKRAAHALDQRTMAVSGMQDPGSFDVGDAYLSGSGVSGDGAARMRLMWADLFDLGEFMSEIGSQWAEGAIAELKLRRIDLFSALASVQCQSVAIGVLMERQRWEAQRDRKAAAE